MTKSSLVKIALSAVSAFVLVTATAAAAAPCFVVFHQPETPNDLSARLRAMKRK